MRLAFALLAAGVLAACGSKPPAPDWQVNAHGALERYEKAYLTGGDRAAASEFNKARGELSSTGQAGLVARAELTRCAVQVASLVFDDCTGFEALRADAPAAEQAYADFLAGRASPQQAALLPAPYRAVDAASLAGIEDPLSRLVAAGVLLRTGRATPQTLAAAIDTASQQGWRRPLVAWLGAQAMRAEQAGAADEAQRIRRRIALVQGGA
jgi:hypothetical protein